MNNQYGLLLNQKDILIQRKYFEEMTQLIGVRVIHRAPRKGKSYTTYGEIDSNYFEPEEVGCIFDEHPTQRTMKRLGWNAELDTNASIISVPYDLNGLQKGSLFVIPSAFDNTKGRLFRVEEISGIMIYPCSLTCRLVPEYETTFANNLYNHQNNSFNLLNREEGYD
jgi:hypothetical protein